SIVPCERDMLPIENLAAVVGKFTHNSRFVPILYHRIRVDVSISAFPNTLVGADRWKQVGLISRH
ncbi:MAG: hypothetical protein AAFV54_11000, partial [Pseudomonadota bacterium]